jgi:hypothetical protein
MPNFTSQTVVVCFPQTSTQLTAYRLTDAHKWLPPMQESLSPPVIQTHSG